MTPIFKKLHMFSPHQLNQINGSAEFAEDLVFDFFKLPDSHSHRSRYDIKTLQDLSKNEIVHGPFAQVVRYCGLKKGASLGSAFFDYYKICLQDHSIIKLLKSYSHLKLFPFSLYIITHELIHIVRFSRFLQSYEANDAERMIEEVRVHKHTYNILKKIKLKGMEEVLGYYGKWMEKGIGKSAP